MKHLRRELLEVVKTLSAVNLKRLLCFAKGLSKNGD